MLVSSAFASEEVMRKLDERIKKLESSPVTSITKTVHVPWSLHEKKEAQLWTSVLNAYDMLKSNARLERYNFIYEALRAGSLGHPERIGALEVWIKNENARLQKMGFNPTFYAKWDHYVQEVLTAIKGLNTERPQMQVPFKKSNSEYITLLKEVREDLKNSVATQATMSNIEARTSSSKNTSDMMILISACLVFFAGGYAISQRKKPVRKVVKIKERVVYREAPQALPSLPDEAFDTVTSEMKINKTTNYSTSLEEECSKVLTDNQHLLEIAALKLTPMTRSPFKSTVNAPSDTVNEALQWLLKGTIAIANTSGSKISHMEWKCIENQGRVSIDFILHGLECDSKSLYLNTLLDGEASAPAHFNRTETTLDGFGANVSFRSGNKKTVVSLGMDSLTGIVSH